MGSPLLEAVESCLGLDCFHIDLQSAPHYVAPGNAGAVVDSGSHPVAEVLHNLGEGDIVVVVVVAAGVFRMYLGVEYLHMALMELLRIVFED